MNGIIWNDAYNIGNSEIDSQHKQLIAILNELYEAQSKGLGQIAITNTLSKLVDYTNYHFTSEQQMHSLYKYPGAAQQKAEHREFVFKLEALKRDSEKKDLLLTLKTLDFLKDWIITHILGTDKAFGDYLHKIEMQ